MSNAKRSVVTDIRAFLASAKKCEKLLVNERDFYSLSYRNKGKVSIEANEKEIISSEGSITFIPKGLSYSTEIIEDTEMLAIHFRLNSDVDFRNAEVVYTQSAELKALFERLIKSYPIEGSVDFRSMSLFYELLARLEALPLSVSQKPIPEKIKRARDLIEKNYAEPYLSVASVADTLSVSTSYLRREFLAAYGSSTVSFLRLVRIENAKRMLESGYLSVSNIASACGFSSASYFIQVFSKHVGISPEAYRKRISV